MLAYLPTLGCEGEGNRVKFKTHSDVKFKEKRSNVNLLNATFWESVWEAITPKRTRGRIKGGGKKMSEWDRKQMSMKGTACTEMKCYLSKQTHSHTHIRTWCERRTFWKCISPFWHLCHPFFSSWLSEAGGQVTHVRGVDLYMLTSTSRSPGTTTHINLQEGGVGIWYEVGRLTQRSGRKGQKQVHSQRVRMWSTSLFALIYRRTHVPLCYYPEWLSYWDESIRYLTLRIEKSMLLHSFTFITS